MSNQENKIVIWTDVDMDGAASYLTLSWYLGQRYEVHTTTVKNFRERFLNWQNKNNIKHYKDVYILDLDVSNDYDIIDQKNITIIDHHSTHINTKHVYTNATTIIEDCESCCKLILKHFKFAKTLTREQLRLIAIVNDYDCYKLQYPESNDLNNIFWYGTGNRLLKFCDEFNSGFSKFTDFNLNIINLHNKRLQNLIENLEVYYTQINKDNQFYNVCSAFADVSINEVSDYLMTKYDADITIIVNLSSKAVSFRRKVGCPVNMGLLAKKLCEGGGHEAAGGGKITEIFTTFSKSFKLKTI